MSAGDSDPFLDAYLAGTPTEVPAAPPAVAPTTRAEPRGPLALHGCVLTPEGPLERRWVVVEDGRVFAVADRRPPGVPGVRTDGVILPGLIDLHGHPEFNVFAAWEPPTRYDNRYVWRASDEYHRLIRDPQNKLQTELPAGTELRYAEVRALAGGVTAIQGASGTNPATDASLVRNVDLRVFGQHHARAMIDLPAGPGAHGYDTLTAVLAAVRAGEVDAFYLHLAEGRRDDARSAAEFDTLVSLDALTAATIVIHGSALTRDQLGALRDAGAKLVWSPQSNLRLYGETTRAADAFALGLPVALGADWLPSGSTSLLAEVKVARQELANQGLVVDARTLVDMVTVTAAGIAGLADHLGAILPGRPADLVVVARRHYDAYEAVCQATPNDVELVTVGGALAYGRADWVAALGKDPTAGHTEPVLAWGRRMLLDTGNRADGDGGAGPPLSQLRRDLTRVYPPVGPIWS